MDGDSIGRTNRRTNGVNRKTDFKINIADKIYLLCAVHFGWDKFQVDKLPITYLHRLILTFIEDSKSGSGSGGAMTTTMKQMGKMLK